MKRKKRQIGFVVVLLLMTALAAGSVSAKQYTIAQARKNMVYVPFDGSRDDDFQYISVIHCHKTGQIIMKSLKYDEDRLTVDVNQSKEYRFCNLYVKPKKTGTSQISFKYKHKGTTEKITLTVKAFKMSSCPVKSILFGKKKLAMNWMGLLFTDIQPAKGKKTCSGKVTVTLKNGWNLKEFRLGDETGAGKKISMTDKVTLEKWQYLYVTIKNAKGNEAEFIIRCGVDW